MLTSIGGVTLLLALAAGGGMTVQPDTQPTGPAVAVALKVERDGTLSVTERITVPDGELHRHQPLRVAVDDDEDRVYTVTELRMDGPGRARVVDGALDVTVSGTSTVSYMVGGAVADVPDGQQVRWQPVSGWDGELVAVSVSFAAPVPNVSMVDCFAGAPGTTGKCDLAQPDHLGVLRVEHADLDAGARIDLGVGMPERTVPANARFERVDTAGSAFALTPVVLAGFAAVVVLLLALAAAVVVARRRDAATLVNEGEPVDVLLRDGDRVFFASPDGVLPGQVGAVIDETVDPVDVAGTVIDLAVRNYLWIAETDGAGGAVDWQLSRRNPPDEQLHGYERAVYEAVLPEGTESVLVSELRAPGRIDLAAVRAALYSDAVRQGWLTSRRTGWTSPWVGGGLTLAGIVLTGVLVLTVGHALLGVALAVAGLAVLLVPRGLPARTGRGRLLVGQIRALVSYLHSTRAADVPAADRELVFSRSLPYAVVLDETEHWLSTFGDLDPEADGAPGIGWFGGFDGDRDLRRFASRFPTFVTALEGTFAESTHRAALRLPAGAPA